MIYCASFILLNELNINLKPIIKNVIEAIDFNITSGRNLDIEPPANAPIKHAKTNAEDDPRKTARGFLDVPPKLKVAICVLSPNSAINTVINVEINKFKIIYI